MNEEHHEETVTEAKPASRNIGKWTAFVAAMVLMSAVATSSALADKAESSEKAAASSEGRAGYP